MCDRLIRPLLAEFLAVVFSVFTVTLIEAYLQDRKTDVIVSNCIVSVAESVCFLAFLLSFNRDRGMWIHINPAITMGCLFTANTPWYLCFLIFIIQVVGATGGVLLHHLVTINQSPVIPRLITFDGETWLKGTYQLVMCQTIATFTLVLCYLVVYPPIDNGNGGDGGGRNRSTSYHALRDRDLPTNPAGLASAVMLASFLSHLNSTASWNPVKSLGISLAVSARYSPDQVPSWQYHFIFWLGPVIGSLFASFLYRLVFADNDRRLSNCGRSEPDL